MYFYYAVMVFQGGVEKESSGVVRAASIDKAFSFILKMLNDENGNCDIVIRQLNS